MINGIKRAMKILEPCCERIHMYFFLYVCKMQFSCLDCLSFDTLSLLETADTRKKINFYNLFIFDFKICNRKTEELKNQWNSVKQNDCNCVSSRFLWIKRTRHNFMTCGSIHMSNSSMVAQFYTQPFTFQTLGKLTCKFILNEIFLS